MTQSKSQGAARAAKVLSKDRLGGGVIRLRLAPQGGPLAFSPGQYLRLTFGELEPRDYSLANQPGDGYLEFHIRDHGEGGASGFISDALRAGDQVGVDGPYGSCILERGDRSNLIGVAGGTGLAPVLAILEQALREGGRDRVDLLLGVRRKDELFLEDHFNNLSETYDNFNFFISVGEGESGTWHRGLVTELLSPRLLQPALPRAYIAGPPAMVAASREKLRGLGLPDQRIHADA